MRDDLAISAQQHVLTMFSLPQVIPPPRELRDAASIGDIQACWMHAVHLRAIHTAQTAHLSHSVRSI